ncbi:helix-turn-helix transcriptional regulator [Streptomyces sp. NPDC015242]|uniref:helix-turn-helix transcriptional regulator n=1 Tax=Streptomyces sp. NPDC015242 TaxID=3364951 RepID=UPI0036FC0BC2
MGDDGGQSWSFFTAHARVLAEIARNPDARMRDIALTCRITERSVHRIVTDLERARFLSRRRIGRRNHYLLHPDREHRHPAEAHLPVPAMLDLLTGHGHATSETPMPARRPYLERHCG